MAYKEKNDQDILDKTGEVISRVCKGCGIRKDIADYYKANYHMYRRRKCKKCVGIMRQDNYAKNTDEHKERHRKSHLRKKYGITLNTFFELLEAQNSRCAICNKLMDSSLKVNKAAAVQVDHDHVTGVVRGLLCFSCNTGLGKFQDSVEVMRKAIDYLENPPNVEYRDKFLACRERHHAKLESQIMVDLHPADIPRANRQHLKFLSPEEKNLIRQEYSAGNVSQKYLAIRWSCTVPTISKITSDRGT